MTRILFIQARGPKRTSKNVVGFASGGPDGWWFRPFSTARQGSRKAHATWELSLPRWTGGLDRTESIKMLPGEKIPDALKRFPDVPEFA